MAPILLTRCSRPERNLFIIGVVVSMIKGEWHIASYQNPLLSSVAGATYFYSEFGPNTTTLVYPAEIFPVRVRTTCHGIAAEAGKIGAVIGTYALTWLLPDIGLSKTSAIVAGVFRSACSPPSLPEPKGASLEELTEISFPSSVAALGVAESRGTRPPAA